MGHCTIIIFHHPLIIFFFLIKVDEAGNWKLKPRAERKAVLTRSYFTDYDKNTLFSLITIKPITEIKYDEANPVF